MQFARVEGLSFTLSAFSSAEPVIAPTRRSFRARRRDRHGRGLRGPLMLTPLPGARSRSERFDDLVVDSADRLEEIWGAAMDRVQFAVEEIPSDLENLISLGEKAPLAAFRAADAKQAATITVYRKPIEQCTESEEELREVVHDAVVEQVAVFLNLSPESVDPSYGRMRRF
ncbi:metallopeptidase family protein [Psychromicrobium lacuslunae]|uniref:Peptidase n=1 Tax=Psychromicrobium lacuslunae TaxID=1618207 RepID=A0A0D4BVF5_9MICC|nr:metallopeptidase family protein [Psychromicrobium lacuslunae]AJT40422.1 hypothetical protein UM93_00590 [Psychromicrobium lacuslunae]